jgi:hypothetical protein
MFHLFAKASKRAPMSGWGWPTSQMPLSRLSRGSILTIAALAVSTQLALAQFTQQGPKLVGNGTLGSAVQGASVALSADGNTAIVGGPGDYLGSAGAALVYSRSGGVWTQKGSALVGTGAVGGAAQGRSVALSADGNTAIVGGPADNTFNAFGAGAAWVFTRSDGVWTQQGSKLFGTGAVGNAEQGFSVALSADGNTAIVGGPNDNPVTVGAAGAAWVFTRSNGVWTQQGSKLVGAGANVQADFGYSVALSADGNTAIVGGPGDGGNAFTGAAWIFTRNNGAWTQQGGKLVSNSVYPAQQGTSVALSADGNTAIAGAPLDGTGPGAAWIYTRSGDVWTQQGVKLAATGAVGATPAGQGGSVALSGDGKTAILGGRQDNGYTGAAWGFFLNGGVWTQQSNKLVGTGTVGNAYQGWSVALSADGSTAILGGPADNSDTGAAWVFTEPSLQVASNADIMATGNQGGPFLPGSFQYQLSATDGSVGYSILGVPNWLTPSSASGAASSGTAVTFAVNTNANSLTPGTYAAVITFANTGSNQGTQSRNATLVVNPAPLVLTPSTGIAASGMRGGTFSPSSFHYSLKASYGTLNYSITTPTWLTVSSKSGSVTTSAKTITFTINSSAHSLAPNTYVSSVNVNNTTNGAGNSSHVATLIVEPKDFKLTVSASPSAEGSVAGGGEVAEGSTATVTAMPNSGFQFVQWTENGSQVSTSSSYTFMMPSKAITLVAHFQKN